MNKKYISIKKEIVSICKILYERNMVSSTGGNVSVRRNDEIFITPTGKSLGRLTSEMIVRTNLEGKVLGNGKPSKEIFMHCAVYHARKDINALAHVHAAYSTALSCLVAVSNKSVLSPMTPGFVLRIGNLPMIRYYRPGSSALANAIFKLAIRHNAILLQNHGLVSYGKDLENAVNIAEEIEENAKIYILTGRKGRKLNPDEVKEILDFFKI